MKFLKLFKQRTELGVAEICKKYYIENWSINKDGLVDVDGNVSILSQNITKLPLRFGKVTGDFFCYKNKLTTLEGAPKEVGGNFSCHDNELTTLEGAPKEVGGDFYCYRNKLITLKGSPIKISGNFSCHINKLFTLEGGPTEVGGSFYCFGNKLTTLEGGPREVSEHFNCLGNKLTTLKWAPEYVGGNGSFLPNLYLPKEFLDFFELNGNRDDLQAYIFKWQKDYAIWRRDGSFNEANFIQMMEAAQDELQNIKFQ